MTGAPARVNSRCEAGRRPGLLFPYLPCGLTMCGDCKIKARDYNDPKGGQRLSFLLLQRSRHESEVTMATNMTDR
jgi:hypothetical protein